MAAAPTPPPSNEPATDPSMEDILASIRRILNEDEAPKPAPDPAPPAEVVHDGVLVLDASMMVPDQPVQAPMPEPTLPPGLGTPLASHPVVTASEPMPQTPVAQTPVAQTDRKSTRLNSSH